MPFLLSVIVGIHSVQLNRAHWPLRLHIALFFLIYDSSVLLAVHTFFFSYVLLLLLSSTALHSRCRCRYKRIVPSSTNPPVLSLLYSRLVRVWCGEERWKLKANYNGCVATTTVRTDAWNVQSVGDSDVAKCEREREKCERERERITMQSLPGQWNGCAKPFFFVSTIECVKRAELYCLVEEGIEKKWNKILKSNCLVFISHIKLLYYEISMACVVQLCIEQKPCRALQCVEILSFPSGN